MTKGNIYKSETWIVYGCFFSLCLLILFALPRGFDFTDEGLYLLLAKPSQENFAGIFNYDLFFKLIHEFTGVEFGVIGMRILRIFTHMVGALFLRKFGMESRLFNRNKILSFFICFSCLVASYGFLPQSLSYNHLTLLAGCIWIYAISKKNVERLDILWLGVSLGILFYAKITACFLLSILTLFWAMYKIFSNQIKKRFLILLPIPFVFCELLFLMILGESAIFRVLDAVPLRSGRPGYLWGNMVKNGIVGIFWTAIVSIPFSISGYFHESKSRSRAIFILASGILLYVAYITTITAEYSHYLVFVAISLLAFESGRALRKGLTIKSYFLPTILMVLPYVLYFGSNIYFFRLSIHYLIFWYLAYLVLRYEVNSQVADRSYRFMSLAILVVVSTGLWIFPSHYPPLHTANKDWFNGVDTIKVSSEQFELLQELDSKMENMNHSNVLFVFANPGVPYLLNRSLPKTPLIWNEEDLKTYFNPNEVSAYVYNGFEKIPYFYWNKMDADTIRAGGFEYILLER